ncbi:hypothetical protein [Neobacillus soli]|uniref:hypothetical protein n=1 Tax=Neobacillus soli TaxID=220688 RepID=UPI000B155EC7
MFEKGFISFTDEGTILISDRLDAETKIFLNINETKKILFNDDCTNEFRNNTEDILKPNRGDRKL